MTTDRKDAQFMRMAIACAPIFSTCAKRQYYAIIVDAEKRVIGTGFNGSPPGTPHCTDGACPRAQEQTPSGQSYSNCISIHAEMNALMYSDRTARLGGTLYINGQPCWDCGKTLAGSGLARVVHIIDPSYADAARTNQMISSTGIQVVGMNLNELDRETA